MGYGSLAPVLTGWTGAIGTTTLTVTPFARESAASLIARFVHEALTRTGDLWTVSVTSGGYIGLASETFGADFVISGNTADRLGFVAGSTGGNEFNADAPFTGGWVPERGMRLIDPLLASSSSRPTGDGTGGVAPVRVSASSRIDAWHTSLASADMPSADYRDWDYWHDGRVFGRFAIQGKRHVPLGRLRTVDTTRTEFDVQEVA